MTQLILLIGLPGSGKSFLAQTILNHHPQYQLISTDQMRSQLFGDEAIQGSWLKIWVQIQVQFQQAILQTPVVIYDATNAQRRHRREVIRLAQQIGFFPITGLWVNTSLEVCLNRNQMRSRHVPEEIIIKMHRQLTGAPPSLSDGFDNLIIKN